MREAGRLALLTDGQFTDLMVKRVVNYVVSRQNVDGGYTFCRETESNAQDTYYGLAILDLLDVSFPNVEKTVEWLRSFVPDSLYSHYYVARALKLCGEQFDEKILKKFVLSLPITRGEFGTVDVYAEVASEFLLVFIATELANMVDVEVNREKV
ncbi:MAG: hypothetical protein QXL54_02860, partial [Candidatus Bathyarchaeia archaeon]